MKNINSTEEGVWREVVSINLTEEEMTILYSNEDTDNVRILRERLNNERYITLDEETRLLVQTTYDNNKPTLKDGDIYQLISADFILNDDNKVNGIINCRVGEDHIQVRL